MPAQFCRLMESRFRSSPSVSPKNCSRRLLRWTRNSSELPVETIMIPLPTNSSMNVRNSSSGFVRLQDEQHGKSHLRSQLHATDHSEPNWLRIPLENGIGVAKPTRKNL